MDLPDPGIEPGFPVLQVDSLSTELSGKPLNITLLRGKGNLNIPLGLPRWFSGEESACQSASGGDAVSIPQLGRTCGEEMSTHSSILDFCLDNSMGRGAWQATVQGVARVRHGSTTKTPPPIIYFQ